jgi:hypothetical protein
MLLELELFVSQQGFQVGSMMLLGETLELSLELAIEGRFDGSRCVVPSVVVKKYVDTLLGRQLLNTNQRQCSLNRGGRSVAWREARVSCLTAGRSVPWGRTVRALGPDGPRVRRGCERSPVAPGSRSREGPHRGGEILGDSRLGQIDLDSFNRRRVEEKRRIWGLED